nr:CASP-like protein 2B1 [Ipomoea batatas]
MTEASSNHRLMPELRHCSSCHPCPRCSALSEGKEVAASRLSCFDGPPEEKTEVHVATCRHGREGDEKDRGTKRDGEQERVNPRSPAASPESLLLLASSIDNADKSNEGRRTCCRRGLRLPCDSRRPVGSSQCVVDVKCNMENGMDGVLTTKCVSMIRGSVLFNKPLAWAIFSGDQLFDEKGKKYVDIGSEDLASRMEKISLCGGFSEQEYVGIVDLFPERITAEQEQIV